MIISGPSKTTARPSKAIDGKEYAGRHRDRQSPNTRYSRVRWIGEIAPAKIVRDHAGLHDCRIEQIAVQPLEDFLQNEP
jgi:hypothetical protein